MGNQRLREENSRMVAGMALEGCGSRIGHTGFLGVRGLAPLMTREAAGVLVLAKMVQVPVAAVVQVLVAAVPVPVVAQVVAVVVVQR